MDEASEGPKTLRAIEKQGNEWRNWRPGPDEGGLPASFASEQCVVLNPKLVQGKTDFEGQADYVVFGNEG